MKTTMNYWQATTFTECCSTSRHHYTKVRPRPVILVAWRVALTRLDILECVHYKLGVTVQQCLHDKDPKYLVDCCTPVSDIASQQHLHSASQHHLTVPSHWLNTIGRRAFSVEGPTVWNQTVSVTWRSVATVSDNCWIRTYFDVTIEYTQCSRDASWLSAIYIHNWHWEWHWQFLTIQQICTGQVTLMPYSCSRTFFISL